MKRLETKRFVLRQFEDTDIHDLHDILSDQEVNTYLPWFVSQTLEDTKTFLNERIYGEYQKDNPYFLAIESKQNGKVMGYIDLTDIDWNEMCGDLGYGIHKDYWGLGIASEVSQALLKQLQTDGFAYI